MALTDKLTNIANAIRAKTGETSKMSLDEMPEKIDSISGGGDVTPPYIKETYNSSGDLISATLVGQSKVRSNMFNGCSSLKSIIVPDSVTSIGNYAFSGCSGLTSITIGNGVTSIGSNAFYECTGLTGVYIADISKWCGISFRDAYANPLGYAHDLYLDGQLVTNLIIPDGVTSIRYRAFYGCTSLTSVAIHNSVTSVGESAFNGCSGLKSITIPGSVTSIEDSAFRNCSNLSSATLGSGVTSIAPSTFQNCSVLTSITIPDSVTSIGSSAFSGCTALTTINVLRVNPPTIKSNTFSNTSALESIIVPKGSGDAYKSAQYWSSYASKIKEAE